MVQFGNHLKLNVPAEMRERTRTFYLDVCGCKALPAPSPAMELYEFAGGAVIGIFFGDASKTLTESDLLKAAWLELKVPDYAAWKERIERFGVQAVESADKSRFYFQAPGGQVYRLAPLDGGI